MQKLPFLQQNILSNLIFMCCMGEQIFDFIWAMRIGKSTTNNFVNHNGSLLIRAVLVRWF